MWWGMKTDLEDGVVNPNPTRPSAGLGLQIRWVVHWIFPSLKGCLQSGSSFDFMIGRNCRSGPKFNTQRSNARVTFKRGSSSCGSNKNKRGKSNQERLNSKEKEIEAYREK